MRDERFKEVDFESNYGGSTFMTYQQQSHHHLTCILIENEQETSSKRE